MCSMNVNINHEGAQVGSAKEPLEIVNMESIHKDVTQKIRVVQA